MPKRKCSSVDKNLGKNLIKYRKSCGLTQLDVAQLLNLNRSTYTKYELGVSEPSLEILKKIALIFGVDANKLLGVDSLDIVVGEPQDPKKPETPESPEEILMRTLSQDEKMLVGMYSMLSQEEKDNIYNYIEKIKTEKNNNF